MGVRSCQTELNGPDKTFFQIIEQEKNKKVSPRKLELLAPAKNLECGIAAIDHGADAVYIGAPKFGARAAAGN